MKQVKTRWLGSLTRRVSSSLYGWRSFSGLSFIALIISLGLNACAVGQPKLQSLKVGIQSQGRLKQSIAQLAQLLQDDPRAGHVPRKDIEISSRPITAAIEAWKA
ncbi:hypothetical protein H6F86_15565 [Phormidium sp. FACHB-592]|uniref:Uncharacterized protein n=1 Tax=Stenomitos frigidus AS-A4 TaxID=2933935 RepID=A0ABV0KNE6_9CYAN|nr:hypothetical protein [Phormidium sp. FACHB-592]MBD2075286.1 hypothetical protein [Phormidium sp. FACHB-592]